MNKKLKQDLLILHIAGICILFFGSAIESRNISVYLIAEIVWLLLFGYLIVGSKDRWLMALIAMPICLAVEWKLIFITAMSLPYIFDGV